MQARGGLLSALESGGLAQALSAHQQNSVSAMPVCDALVQGANDGRLESALAEAIQVQLKFSNVNDLDSMEELLSEQLRGRGIQDDAEPEDIKTVNVRGEDLEAEPSPGDYPITATFTFSPDVTPKAVQIQIVFNKIEDLDSMEDQLSARLRGRGLQEDAEPDAIKTVNVRGEELEAEPSPADFPITGTFTYTPKWVRQANAPSIDTLARRSYIRRIR